MRSGDHENAITFSHLHPDSAAQLYLPLPCAQPSLTDCRLLDDLPDHKDTRTPQTAADERCGHLPQLRDDLLLCGQTGALHQRHRRAGGQAAGQQLGLNMRHRTHAHIDHQRQAHGMGRLPQLAPVVLNTAGFGVPRHKHHAMRMIAVGE